MNLDTYRLDDLLKLRRQIDDELRARHTRDPENTEHQLRDAAQKWGYALTEVMMGVSPDYDHSVSNIRYKHPYDPNIGWSGAGAKPAWVQQWEAMGHSLEELRVRGRH